LAQPPAGAVEADATTVATPPVTAVVTESVAPPVVTSTDPSDCEVGDWAAWSTCTETCDGGSWHRTRSVVKPATGTGQCIFHLFAAEACNAQPCPVDCVIGDWGEYSVCSVSCGSGMQTRTKPIVVEPAHHGQNCPSEYEMHTTVECEVAGVCPAHCELGDWSAWSGCDLTCLSNTDEAGSQSRSRVIQKHPGVHGEPCESLSDDRVCAGLLSCPIDCEVGDWGTFSECSKTCGSGERVRARPITVQLQHLGHECSPLTENEGCRVADCPLQDCVIGTWGDWGECSKSCGIGFTTRVRTVHEPENSKPCPHIEQTEDCANHHTPGHDSWRLLRCPTDCVQDVFTAWSDCSASCGGGEQRRFRDTLEEPTYGGAKCGPPSLSRSCNAQACPVDCPVGAWQDWSACSATCGAGEHIRTRALIGTAQYGGAACTTILNGIMTCNLGSCPDDTCIVSAFGDWSECTNSCNSGTKAKDRVIIQEAVPGESCSGFGLLMEQDVECNAMECPTACVVGDWGDWDTDKEALNGENLHLIRWRPIVTPGHNGGMACPALFEHSGRHVVCNSNELFGDWSGCSKDCGTGYKYRYYEKFHCSSTAAVKIRARVRQGRHCNSQRCSTLEEAGRFNPIQIPRLHTSIRNGGLFLNDGTEDLVTWPPTTNPTAAPSAAPHACDGGTHFCWTNDDASAACVKSAGADYTCECPEGYVAKREHLTHAISNDWAHLKHLCEAVIPTEAPTKAPTHMPTFPPHHCDVGTHFCWSDSEASASCVKTAGMGYSCECPVGYAQKKMHLAHSISEDWSHLRHLCEATTAPTSAPTEAPQFMCATDLTVCNYPCSHGAHCCSDSINMLGLCGTCMSHACDGVINAD